jgi:cell division protein FtsI/penicillin-binding protein 2
MALLPVDSKTKEEYKRRVYIFSIVPVLFFIMVLFVLFILQIVQGPDYELRAKTNREQFSILPAIRGVIYDRSEKSILAYNRRSFAVTIVPQNLPKDPADKEKLIHELATLLEISEQDILDSISQKSYSKFGSYIVKTDVAFSDIGSFFGMPTRDTISRA